MVWASGDDLTSTNLNNKYGPEFNVKDSTYGAKGDGTTDDTAAIQAAEAAAELVNGVVYFPSGTYLLSAVLEITDTITWRGSGHGSAIIDGNAVESSNPERIGVIDVQAVDGFSMSGLRVESTDNTTVSCMGCSNLIISNNHFFSPSGGANTNVKTLRLGIDPDAVSDDKNIIVTDNVLTPQGSGIFFAGYAGGTLIGATVSGNVLDMVNQEYEAAAIKFDGQVAQGIQDFIISDNVIVGNGSTEMFAGIQVTEGCEDGIVKGNEISGPSNRGIQLDSGQTPIAIKRILVEGNLIHDVAAGGVGLAINITSGAVVSEDLTIRGNFIYNMVGGIRQDANNDSVTRLVIENNMIYDMTGIAMSGIRSDDTVIRYNIVRGSADAQSISLAGTPTGCIITDNILEQSTAAGEYIDSPGTGNLIKRNTNGNVVSTNVSSDSDAVDVTNIEVVTVATGAGSVTIGGFAGGVTDQIIHLVKIESANDAVIENNESTGTQKILTPDGSDITLSTYGGLTLWYSGNYWFVIAQ